MIRQYIYKPEQADLIAWPSGELRLQGIEITLDPFEADLFVCPGGLTMFKSTADLYRLPFFRTNEARHVFFHCSDDETLYHVPCLFIRCNTRPWYLTHDPNTISWPWPVEECSECINVPEGGFKYDVSFQGWTTSHETRKLSTDSCLSTSDLKCDFACYPDFYGYRKPEDPEFHRRRSEFRRSMKESRLALCPESIVGVFPYRFFEAMSAARVPILVGSDFVFPWANKIPYADFAVHIARDQARDTGEVLRYVLGIYSDDEIIERGRLARHYWELYLDRDKWPQLMANAVTEKLETLCASR